MRVVQMSSSAAPSRKLPPPMPYSPPKEAPPFRFDIKSLKADDWILLGIIAVLVLEGSDDYLLLIALGYLFYVGIK